jgi:type III secretion system YscQ/HrcQ family protein
VVLTLWAHAGTARVDLATLRSFRPGRVLVLDRSGLWRESGGEVEGHVVVRVLGSTTALHCRLYGGSLEVESIACSPEASMTSGRRIPDPQKPHEDAGEAVTQTVPSPGATAGGANLARDAPIDIALEIARFQLRLDELERVTPGDVLVTGRHIGESVTLRASNQPIAEGELVDVEGELGVRITRLLGE